MLSAGDRKLAKQAVVAQQRIAELEAERSRTDQLARFRPQSKVVQTGAGQCLRLEAADSFDVVSIDYLNANEAQFASESVGRSGSTVDIPLSHQHLVQVMNCGPWVKTFDHSAHVILRVHLSRNGYPSEFKHSSYWDGSSMKLIA